VDEFGPLNLQPRPGRQWAAVGGKNAEPGRAPRRRMRATYTRTAGVRHLFAAYELGEDKLFGHIKPRKTRGRFLEFCPYPQARQPAWGPHSDGCPGRRSSPGCSHARRRYRGERGDTGRAAPHARPSPGIPVAVLWRSKYSAAIRRDKRPYSVTLRSWH
jgi:hypothetical protein